MPVSIGGSGFITGLDQGIDGVGIITATSFSGPLTGNVTGDLTSSGVSTVGQLNVGTGGTIITTTSGGDINIDSGGVYYDASNNRLAIGTTNPGETLDVVGQIRTTNTTAGSGLVVKRSDSVNASGALNFTGSDDTVDASIRMATDVADALTFQTAGTERVRIASNGAITIDLDNNGLFVFDLSSGSGTSTLKYAHTTNGQITFDTSSRLVKENIEDCPYGLAEIKQLKPRKYFRTDDQQEEIGFIADEVIGFLPEFVPTGPKSAITRDKSDTEIIPIGVNYEKLTAVLTKALQEAMERIEQLESEMVAVKAQLS